MHALHLSPWPPDQTARPATSPMKKPASKKPAAAAPFIALHVEEDEGGEEEEGGEVDAIVETSDDEGGTASTMTAPLPPTGVLKYGKQDQLMHAFAPALHACMHACRLSCTVSNSCNFVHVHRTIRATDILCFTTPNRELLPSDASLMTRSRSSAMVAKKLAGVKQD